MNTPTEPPKPRKCGMFFWALVMEFYLGKAAREKGEPRQCRLSPDYPELEAAWYKGYDAPPTPPLPDFLQPRQNQR